MSGEMDVSEKRLWKTLDAISQRLDTIDDKLSDIVRLEEKIISISKDVARLETEVSDLKEDRDIAKGRNDIEGKIFKWVMGIIAALLAFTFRGSGS